MMEFSGLAGEVTYPVSTPGTVSSNPVVSCILYFFHMHKLTSSSGLCIWLHLPLCEALSPVAVSSTPWAPAASVFLTLAPASLLSLFSRLCRFPASPAPWRLSPCSKRGQLEASLPLFLVSQGPLSFSVWCPVFWKQSLHIFFSVSLSVWGRRVNLSLLLHLSWKQKSPSQGDSITLGCPEDRGWSWKGCGESPTIQFWRMVCCYFWSKSKVLMNGIWPLTCCFRLFHLRLYILGDFSVL